MNTKDAVGKRILRIEQSRVGDGRGGTHWDVSAIVLENGTRLIPRTVETEHGEYLITIEKVKPISKRKKTPTPPAVQVQSLLVGDRVEIDFDSVGWVAGAIVGKTDHGGFQWEADGPGSTLKCTIYSDSSRVRRIKG